MVMWYLRQVVTYLFKLEQRDQPFKKLALRTEVSVDRLLRDLISLLVGCLSLPLRTLEERGVVDDPDISRDATGFTV
jgi:hypothetical protein